MRSEYPPSQIFVTWKHSSSHIFTNRVRRERGGNCASELLFFSTVFVIPVASPSTCAILHDLLYLHGPTSLVFPSVGRLLCPDVCTPIFIPIIPETLIRMLISRTRYGHSQLNATAIYFITEEERDQKINYNFKNLYDHCDHLLRTDFFSFIGRYTHISILSINLK